MDVVARKRIQRNLDETRRRIGRAAERSGRDPASVRLVAVVKSVGLTEARYLLECGQTELAENRVESARLKVGEVGEGVCWHMVGKVQRRKVPEVLDLFDRVDSVDRLSLAQALSSRCVDAKRTLPIHVQVNVAGEANKSGFTVNELPEALAAIRNLPGLRVDGLMTLAPQTDDPETLRPVFARLRDLAHAAGVEGLSMGMSDDFEIAIEEGATEVRIGSTLFK